MMAKGSWSTAFVRESTRSALQTRYVPPLDVGAAIMTALSSFLLKESGKTVGMLSFETRRQPGI